MRKKDSRFHSGTSFVVRIEVFLFFQNVGNVTVDKFLVFPVISFSCLLIFGFLFYL